MKKVFPSIFFCNICKFSDSSSCLLTCNCWLSFYCMGVQTRKGKKERGWMIQSKVRKLSKVFQRFIGLMFDHLERFSIILSRDMLRLCIQRVLNTRKSLPGLYLGFKGHLLIERAKTRICHRFAFCLNMVNLINEVAENG